MRCLVVRADPKFSQSGAISKSRKSRSRRRCLIELASRSSGRSVSGHYLVSAMSACCVESTSAARSGLASTCQRTARPRSFGPFGSRRDTRARVSRKDGTECPLDGPRARKGAGSGGTPDMADTRENQSNQGIVMPRVGELPGDIMYLPTYPIPCGAATGCAGVAAENLRYCLASRP